MTARSDPQAVAAGVVLAVPRGTLPSQEEADAMFLPASEARAFAIPSVKKRLGSAGSLDVGLVVIDGRVLGYVDFSPADAAGKVCVVAAIDAKADLLDRGSGARKVLGEIALLGVRVLATGQFPATPDGRAVQFAGRDVPVIAGAQVASYVERLSDSHRIQKLEGS